MMTSILISTIAYFIAAYFLKRYLENMGIPKGPTRTIVIVVIALALAYGIAAVVEWAAK